MACRIVIVDDHPSFRAPARAILEAGGLEVVGEAADGASAVEVIRRLRPDVVLLDIQLPDATGFEVGRLLQQANGSVPAIVFVSSRDLSDYGELVQSSGACGFVPKDELSSETIAALIA